jgi:4-hydroxy-3-methylbut-2-enyl diphosphate reductase
MIIIGGYNSSNTNNLVAISQKKVKTYHIDNAGCIEGSGKIRHKPYGKTAETEETDWLPGGPLRVGLTAGASTPNYIIGMVVEKILMAKDYSVPRDYLESEMKAPEWVR